MAHPSYYTRDEKTHRAEFRAAYAEYDSLTDRGLVNLLLALAENQRYSATTRAAMYVAGRRMRVMLNESARASSSVQPPEVTL